MNWRQLHTASTSDERIELLIEIASRVEAHKRRLLLVRGRLIRERRRQQPWHFIGDRRTTALSGAERRRRATYKLLFIGIAPVLLGATWAIAIRSQPIHGAALILGYDIILAAILFTKPYKWLASRLTSA